MIDEAATDALVVTARVVAHEDDLGTALSAMLDVVARAFGIASAAIVVERPSRDGLEIVASYGIDEEARTGLAGAIGRSTHPIARTFEVPEPTYDVAPTAPGGPALRSHLPLTVSRGGTETVLGVLALAHEDPIDPANQRIFEAVADLAAVAIERSVAFRTPEPVE